MKGQKLSLFVSAYVAGISTTDKIGSMSVSPRFRYGVEISPRLAGVMYFANCWAVSEVFHYAEAGQKVKTLRNIAQVMDVGAVNWRFSRVASKMHTVPRARRSKICL